MELKTPKIRFLSSLDVRIIDITAAILRNSSRAFFADASQQQSNKNKYGLSYIVLAALCPFFRWSMETSSVVRALWAEFTDDDDCFVRIFYFSASWTKNKEKTNTKPFIFFGQN